MKRLDKESWFFYSKTGETWEIAPYSVRWIEEKCEDYLYKHLTYEEHQLIVNPPKTGAQLFSQEFKARKAKYDDDINQLSIAMAGIILNDGTSEAERKSELQALKVQTETTYKSEILALRVKYYG